MKMASAERKFARGIGQVREIIAEVDEFESSGAYVFNTVPRVLEPHTVEFHVYAESVHLAPDHWPLLAGEAIQNLRSALDHFVYEASGGRDYTQFPICVTQSDFRKEAKSRLKGVPESARASIERGQPYNWTPQQPSGDLLAILNKWSNADKHRTLSTIISVIRTEAVGVPDGASASWLQFGTGRELEPGGSHVSTFHVTSDHPIDFAEIEAHLQYRVEIEGRQVRTLQSIAQHVYRVLSDCVTGSPLSPLAPYPI